MNPWYEGPIWIAGVIISPPLQDKGQTEYDAQGMSFLKCHLDNYPPHEGALRLNWPRAGHLDFEEIRKSSSSSSSSSSST